MTRSITAIVPAYNEEDGLPDTLESLLRQTVPFDKIIVSDDASRDRTREVALLYGVEVVTAATNLGSKAKAQNAVLPMVETDLVLPVDADTVLSDDYVERMIPVFDDDQVAIAAGCVLTKNSSTVTERGRTVEYLAGFHYGRIIQNAYNAPIVCSGCNSVFRMSYLTEFGGIPERTMGEDMDYTLSQQIAGYRAVYVSSAVAYAADPPDVKHFAIQCERWMSGFFQNVRMHFGGMLKHKKMLALWVLLAITDVLVMPLWYVLLVLGLLGLIGIPLERLMFWFFGAELILLSAPLLYGSVKRKTPLLHVLLCIPAVYVTKFINFVYAWKTMIVELILVPLGLTTGLREFKKGRADTPMIEAPIAEVTTPAEELVRAAA